jgi:hypothetical protein
MKYRVTFVVFGGLTLQLTAQIPGVCTGQLIPLKPVSIFCQSASPVCVPDGNGVGGHWVWGCPAVTGTALGPGAGLDPGLLDSIAHPSAPHFVSPAEAAMEFEHLRQLRLQNQQMDQQLRMVQQSTSALSDSKREADLTSAIRVAYGCGVLNGMLKAMDAMGNTAGADGVREALKRTECEQIVQNAGAEGDRPPVVQGGQSEVCVPEGAGQPLDNDGIMDLVKNTDLKESTIAWLVASRPGSYSVSVDALNRLKASGVPQSVILAIIEKNRCYPALRH